MQGGQVHCATLLLMSSILWEQRWHPFRREWVLYTSHRAGRPWVGESSSGPSEVPPVYDPDCALCPGNNRLHGQNPDYPSVYWFTNDLPCFGSQEAPTVSDDLYQTQPATGTAEVICYHPDHSKTLARLAHASVVEVVALWTERSATLAAREDVSQVLIFENKGALVGTSNPHPHCQIYAGNLVYQHMEREWQAGHHYLKKNGRPLGLEVVAREVSSPRLIGENKHFIACVPWFARYAYEVLILPKRAVTSLAGLTREEQKTLAALLREITIRYDNLWQMPMPYVMAIHQAPCDGRDPAGFPFHVEFHPPLRKPDTLKYLAGPEIGGGSMTNESDPDEKAAELIRAGTQHYLETSKC